MEFFFLIGGLWLVSVIIKALGDNSSSSGSSSASSAGRYFGTPQLKLIDEKPDGLDMRVRRVMFRGMIPVVRPMNVSFTISVVDKTDGATLPVFSLLDFLQEPETQSYQHTGEIGEVSAGTAITDWVELGKVIPDLLQPSHSGTRTLEVVVRMHRTSAPPDLFGGLLKTDMRPGSHVLLETIRFTHTFTEKGFVEAADHREEAQAISLKIGVAVAMSDGSLDDTEGEVLKGWIIKKISGYKEEKSKELKSLFNDALKEGFAEAEVGELSLSELVDRLAEIGDKKTRYDAIELCMEVMAADGVADPEEMAVIRKVASSLDLDMDEIEQLREKVTLSLSTAQTSEEGLEALVGLEASWSDDQKRKHLRVEFQKWSNRLNSLSEEAERQSAQDMLDHIAALRKKYG